METYKDLKKTKQLKLFKKEEKASNIHLFEAAVGGEGII